MKHWYEEDEGLDVDFLDSRTTPSHPLRDPRLVAAFLAQGDAWQPARGDFVAVSDMTPSHALMTAAFILNRATQVAVVLTASGACAADFAADAVEVRRWLLDSPLVRALIRRGSVVEEASTPWASVAVAAGRR